MDGIALLLARTTACTILAFGIARLALRCSQVSPRLHRLAYVLVLLQGWAFVPVVFELPVRTPKPVVATTASSPDAGWSVTTGESPDRSSTRPAGDSVTPTKTIWLGTRWALIPWVAGAVLTAVLYLRQYGSLLYKLPLGRVPIRSQWRLEWEEAARESAAGSNTQFRLTETIGPLCCYVPFFHLVLAPERLWSDLEPQQRKAILWHELAHVTRGDLWKSAAIRLLALPQWFNPLAWRAVRAFDEAAEWACDDFVMSAYDEECAASYPPALLRIAENTLQPLPGSVAAGGGMLKTRILRLVQPRFKEETKMKKAILPLLLCGCVLVQSIRIEAVASDDPDDDPTPAATSQSSATSSKEPSADDKSARRAADLKKVGLVPYVVETPDVLTVTTSPVAPKGTPKPPQAIARCLVGPAGQINLPGAGQITVSGLTVEEIERVIQRALARRSQERTVSVSVTEANSKVIYVIVDGDSDYVYRLPCTPDSHVAGVLSDIAWPHPFELKKAKCRVQRMKGAAIEVLPVDMAAIAKREAPQSNPKLLPGDRLFVTVEGQQFPAAPTLNRERRTEAAAAVPVTAESQQIAAQPSPEPTAVVSGKSTTTGTIPSTLARPRQMPAYDEQPGVPAEAGDMVTLNVKMMELQLTKMRKLGLALPISNGIELTRMKPEEVAKLISSLEANGLISVLAEPTLATISGRSATMQTGGEIPIVVPQGQGKVSVEYRQIGTRLECLPNVLKNGRIRLELRSEFSEIDESRSVQVSGQSIPSLRVRSANTAAEVANGETLLVGGLVQTHSTEGSPEALETALLMTVQVKRFAPAKQANGTDARRR